MPLNVASSSVWFSPASVLTVSMRALSSACAKSMSVLMLPKSVLMEKNFSIITSILVALVSAISAKTDCMSFWVEAILLFT